MRRLVPMLGAVLVLTACGEKPQTADATARKSDEKAWAAQDSPFITPGWKSGDQTSWEQQMRNRSQNQNEYARAPAAAKP